MIVEGTTHALDRTLKNPIPFQDLLLFNTCTSIELLREIFSKKHSMDEEVRSQVLKTLNGEYIIGNCKWSIMHIFFTLASVTALHTWMCMFAYLFVWTDHFP